MGFQARTRDAVARGLVSLYRSLHKTKLIDFSTNGVSWTPLYADPGEGAVSGSTQIAADVDDEARKFSVPRQYTNGNTGTLVFPPLDSNDSPLIGTAALVRYEGKIYAVQTWRSQGNGAEFELECTFARPVLLGVKK